MRIEERDSRHNIQNMLKWYPVYTNPRSEKKAYELLKAKGIEAYLPLQRQLKQWSDRKKWVEEPLIKSYLFVKIQISEIAEVLKTQGVCRFLYFSGKIASMPEKQITDLKLLLANEADFEITSSSYTPGQLMLVNAGPLKGLRGELVTVFSQKKLLIRIEHTGHSVLVQVPAAFMESIPEPVVSNGA